MTDVLGEMTAVNDSPTALQLADAVSDAMEATALVATPETVPESNPVADAQAALTVQASNVPTEDDIIAGLLGGIKPVAEMSPYLRLLIFGDPGVRKTSFCAGAPKPLLYEVDFGGGKSLLNHEELKHTRVMQYKSMFQINQLIKFLKDDHEAFKDVETLIIDTGSMLEAKSLATFGTLADGRPDYNSNSGAMKSMFDEMRQIKKHLIVTCHTKEEKDQTTGVILRRPDMTPGVARLLNGMFDVIGYMDLKEGGEGKTEWTLRLAKTASSTGKSRVGGLPEVMVDPKFSTILTAYEAMRANATN